MSKQTYYNNDWEDLKIYPKLAEWITKGKDNTHFCCKVCNWGSFKVGAMGKTAPIKHMTPSKDTSKKTKQIGTWGKILKSFYSIFKKSPARRSDYLKVNNLHSAHEAKDSSYLFPLKFCGHRWLENGEAITRIIEIAPYLKKYMDFLVKEKVPKKDDRFERIKLFLADPVSPAILQFALIIMKELESFLELFQAERPLSFFLYEKLKAIVLSLWLIGLYVQKKLKDVK